MLWINDCIAYYNSDPASPSRMHKKRHWNGNLRVYLMLSGIGCALSVESSIVLQCSPGKWMLAKQQWKGDQLSWCSWFIV